MRRAPYNPDAVWKAVAFWESRAARYPDRFLEYRELAGDEAARAPVRKTGVLF